MMPITIIKICIQINSKFLSFYFHIVILLKISTD